MAHRLNVRKKFILHQALHGYLDGHIQLAISTNLRPRDEKRLLALSDISGPGARIREKGYLTGYPLAESGFFALGRTWSAPEIPRPGCVWTHTLLIDFTDLAELGTLMGLLELFRRPQGTKAAQEYTNPCIFVPDAHARVSRLAEDWARQVMAGLYGRPRRPIVAGHFGDEVDRTVLALWSQQWPRLRRSFRFCTFSASDRSVDNASFDLQVVSRSEHTIRKRFSDAIDAETVVAIRDRWLDDAIQDLLRPDGFGLRDFFRRHGADIVVGREAFSPLCRLHRIMTSSHGHPAALGDAFAVLDGTLRAQQARTAWETVTKAAFEHMETLDESSFGYLWNNLNLVDAHTLICGAARLGKLAWLHEPSMLVPFVDDSGPFKVVVERTLDVLDGAELIAGLARAPALRETALAQRPELVGLREFWANLDDVDEAFQVVKCEHLEAVALGAMLASRDDLAPHAVQEFGSKLVLQSLCNSWDSVGDGVDSWLHALVGDSAAVAEFLATESTIHLVMMYGLARTLPPDAVPNDYGDDPWLISWRHAVGAIDDSASSYMAAYLFNRALGERSLSPGELAQLSFERIHAAAASDRLTDECWRLMEPRLPSSPSWFEWDRCHQLREGVTELFIDRSLAPILFARLCTDNQLFSLLLDIATKRKRGRDYLMQVRRSIEHEGDAKLNIRARMIKECLW